MAYTASSRTLLRLVAIGAVLSVSRQEQEVLSDIAEFNRNVTDRLLDSGRDVLGVGSSIAGSVGGAVRAGASAAVGVAGETAQANVNITTGAVDAGAHVGILSNRLQNNITTGGIEVGQGAANTTFDIARGAIERFSIAGGAGVDPIPEILWNGVELANNISDNVSNTATRLEAGRKTLVENKLLGTLNVNGAVRDAANGKISDVVRTLQERLEAN